MPSAGLGASSAFESVRLSIEGHVGTIELSRPDVLNRFDHTLHRELPDAITAFAAHPEVRAVVLRSTGKVFSAGGSTDLMKEGTGPLPGRRHPP